jgi:hypothetical protein
MTTIFPPLNAFTLVPSTTADDGSALPEGEALTSSTIGIRPDGTGAPGTYPTLVIVPATVTVESLAAINAAIGKNLPPGNYWANAQQTDSLNGQSSTSPWMATEVPFSIPFTVAVPAPPQLSVS